MTDRALRLLAWLRADHFRPAVLIAAAAGGLYGALLLGPPDLMAGALAVTGITPYPPASVMGVNYMNTWTAFHQLAAIPLLLGAGQQFTGMLMNAIFIAGSLSALMMISHALLRRPWLALAVALLVFRWSMPVRFNDYWIDFDGNNYGTLASLTALFAVGLLGSGLPFAAGAVALFAPALHPVVGTWAAGIVCATAAVLARSDPSTARRLLQGAAAGALMSAASFACYWLWRVPAPNGYDADLYRIYMELWDSHRNVDYNPDTLILCVVSVCFLSALLRARRDSSDPGGKALLCALIINGAAAAVMYEAGHRWGPQLPQLFTQIMPARFAGLQLSLLAPIVLAAFLLRRWSVLVLPALAGLAIRWHPAFGVVVGTLACGLLLAGWPRPAARPRYRLAGALVAIAACGAFAWELLQSQAAPKWHALAQSSDRPAFWLVIQNRIARIASEGPPSLPVPQFFGGVDARKLAPSDVFHRQGVVAAPGLMTDEMHLQLHLPMLLDVGSFDFVPYMPGLVTQIAGIIEEVYGVSFRAPPANYKFSGGLDEDEGRKHWRTMTEQDWVRIAPKYCIGGVMAPAGWVVNLPVTRDFGAAQYYRVPAELPGSCR